MAHKSNIVPDNHEKPEDSTLAPNGTSLAIPVKRRKASMKTGHDVIALPEQLIPFIIENIAHFQAIIEDGERIVISIKPGAQMKIPASADRVTHGTPPPRPKFAYTVKDRKNTPALAKRFGFSEPRLRVYKAIFNADPIRGIQSKDILRVTKLPHGSVQQILHWLRSREMITGTAMT